MSKQRMITILLIGVFVFYSAYCSLMGRGGAVFGAEQSVPPPLGSMGVWVCGKPHLIWIIVRTDKEGEFNIVRFDEEHMPSEDTMDNFLKWLASGPTDFVEKPCKETKT